MWTNKNQRYALCVSNEPFLRPIDFSKSYIQWNQDGIVCVLVGHRLYFPTYIAFLSLKIDFVLANSGDLDEMPP